MIAPFQCQGCQRLRKPSPDAQYPYRCSCHTVYYSKTDYVLHHEIGRGWGDYAERIINRFGIDGFLVRVGLLEKKECGGCSKRKVWMNKIGRRITHSPVWLWLRRWAMWLHPR